MTAIAGGSVIQPTLPKKYNFSPWPHVFGSALLFLIGLQFVTGTILALDYLASPTDAYASVSYLQMSVLFGGWLEGVHLWSASAIVLRLLRGGTAAAR